MQQKQAIKKQYKAYRSNWKKSRTDLLLNLKLSTEQEVEHAQFAQLCDDFMNYKFEISSRVFNYY